MRDVLPSPVVAVSDPAYARFPAAQAAFARRFSAGQEAVARRARRLVAREVAAARKALTRELPRVTLAAGRPVRVSPILADLVAAALEAADRSDGAVDPTVGPALLRSRYVAARPWLPACGSSAGQLDRPAHDWRDVHLDGRWLTVPRQVVLDLSATAAARTADRCARLVADRYGVGALVAIAGHVATAAPDGGHLDPRA